MSAEDGGPGRREVAYRLFAAEYDDAELEYSSSEEERAPNYVVTPTGARVNRLFVVGVLTELESVSEDVLRARIVDPTGAFVIYAGQYQPDAQAFLERAEPPMFVAVTGKARTYRPEDGDRIFTSVRPESVNEVDADTRDRWTVQAAAHTLERVRTMAAALERPERGEELAAALRADGVEAGLAEGISLAIDHYGTTTAYLAALRDAAIGAAEVVAGERDEVDPIDLAPDEGGDVPLDADADLAAVAPGIGAGGGEPATTAGTEPSGSSSVEPEATEPADADGDEPAEASTPDEAAEASEPVETVATAETEEPTDGTEAEPTTAAEPEADGDEEAVAGTGSADDLGDFDDFGSDEGVETDELYELDEEERREVEEEYGTEFSTGTEVEEPGEADIETPAPDEIEPDADEADAASVEEPEPAEDETPTEAVEVEPDEPDEGEGEDDEPAEGEPDEAAEAAEPDEATGEDEPDEDVDLADAVMDAMRDLDGGDGAERERVIEAVTDAHGADPADVEEAIQEALMGGRCYEPDDDRLKAI